MIFKDLQRPSKTFKDLNHLQGSSRTKKGPSRTFKDLQGPSRTFKDLNDLQGSSRTKMDLQGPPRTFEDSWVPLISRGSIIGSDMPSALGLVIIEVLLILCTLYTFQI